MTSLLTHLDSRLRSIDYSLNAGISSLTSNPPSLDVFLFHPVFKKRAEIAQDLVSPFERFDLTNYQELFEFYLEQEYKFISPQDLQHGLETTNKYVWLTFDDGYANNLSILPLLEEYCIPATFFIATNHVLQNKPFWWDVVMHFRGRQGIPRLKTLRERNYLKSLRHDKIDEYLYHEFGSGSSKPTSDLNRPMTSAELGKFARSEWVHLGNHTHDHAILTNYDPDGIALQINKCQVALHEMTGITASAISYPDGGYSDVVIAAAQTEGLNIGITTKPARNIPPPTKSTHLMQICRTSLSGEFNIRHQCKALRTNFSPLQKLRGFALKSYQILQPKLGKS